jgi:S-methylmethionine-dependent homocysteine/selenocysteine methylase
MTQYRDNLPQLEGVLCLTDGGIETDLIFHHGIDLPLNAAYVLLEDAEGIARLTRYYENYLAIARDLGAGIVLESATWRANPDWATRLGTSPDEFAALNRSAIEMLVSIRDRWAADVSPIVISGCVGPRSDGYRPAAIMSEYGAQQYHAIQIAAFAATDVDLVTGMTMTNVPEAIGVVRAAEAAGLPVAISFTVETDGCLPTGMTLRSAIERVDGATASAPVYYMINCAHPTHFASILDAGEPWTKRLRGLRANASRRSHAELDESPSLDEGKPEELGAQYRELVERFPHISVLGGCCGTDHRHVREIAVACSTLRIH